MTGKTAAVITATALAATALIGATANAAPKGKKVMSLSAQGYEEVSGTKYVEFTPPAGTKRITFTVAGWAQATVAPIIGEDENGVPVTDDARAKTIKDWVGIDEWRTALACRDASGRTGARGLNSPWSQRYPIANPVKCGLLVKASSTATSANGEDYPDDPKWNGWDGIYNGPVGFTVTVRASR